MEALCVTVRCPEPRCTQKKAMLTPNITTSLCVKEDNFLDPAINRVLPLIAYATFISIRLAPYGILIIIK